MNPYSFIYTYLVVSISIEGDEGVGPEGVNSEGAEYNIRVVELVVVCHPASYESPEGLEAWISAKSRNFLWLAT